MAASFLALVGWSTAWFLLLALLVQFVDPVFTVLFVPLLIYSFYRVLAQLLQLPSALRMARILREYPWRAYIEVPYGLSKHPQIAGRQHGWFEFPNPARPEQRLVVNFPSHRQVGWWHRRMASRAKPELKAQIQPVWFAGDPRFVGLVAVGLGENSRPCRMRILRQQMRSEGGHRTLTDWGATREDIERGRRVGVHVDVR
ncbi:hypothetical protein [Streptomyces sp. NPDC102462]|uniref:hypothetical protein n=1 Tax=Streptomyces sp. NPDC102462 TaxID=3366178 RepID=UPI0038040028